MVFLSIQIKANYFQELVLKTVQEVGFLYIIYVFYVYFLYYYLYYNFWFSSIQTSIWQKNDPDDTLLSQHRVKKEHHLIMPSAKRQGHVLQWNPGVSAFIHVDNVAGLRSHSAEAEIIEGGFFSVTRDTFTNAGGKSFK